MAHLLSLTDTRPQFEIDAPSQPPNPPEPPLPPLKSITTAPQTALVVANESLVTLLRRCFEEEGYTVRIASNTDEGLRLYHDFGPFNVVIIEYDAPQYDGVKIDCLLPQTSGKNLAADILYIKPAQGIIFAAPAYRSPDDLSLPQELIHLPVLIDISIFQLRTLLSTLEVRRAIEALTAADRQRLMSFARCRIPALGRAAYNRTAEDVLEDLLAEAQLKTLIGDRRWNRDFDFVWHIVESMRSIFDCWMKKRGNKETCLFTEISKPNAEGEEISPLKNVASSEAAADRSLIAKEEVDSIFSMFTNDTEATQVLQGWYDDLKPNEVRRKYGFDEKTFAAAKKRIRLKSMSRRNDNGGGNEHGI
jgi:CheY-like chemotaxis protein